MKKMLRKRLVIILIIGTLLSLLSAYFLQLNMQQRDARESSARLFWQIQQLLDENQVEAQEVSQEFREQCLLRANAAAYLLEHSDVDVTDQKEVDRVVDLLQIDELHLFNREGTIFAGSVPKYFGYSFHSGEQMQFFLPMLEDRSLELCQDVTPNTAEGKLMQYAAVWREDGQGIVQIGMEPVRLLRALEKNELSYIFSLLMADEDAALCAADPETYEILGTTAPAYRGKSLADLGFTREQLLGAIRQLSAAEAQTEVGRSFHFEVNGRMCYCMFSYVDGLLLGRFCEVGSLYAPVHQNIVLMALILLAIAILMLWSISYYLDTRIIRSMNDVNSKLRSIADGDLTEKVDVSTTPEFSQLSWYINHMVTNLLNMSARMSAVLDAVHLPIAVYEYGRKTNHVYFTSKLAEILELSDAEAGVLLHDRRLFERTLTQLKSHPVEDNVFLLTGSGACRYVKLEESANETTFFGILVDVSADVAVRQRIERERDVDLLTGLYNRRAFHARMDELFRTPQQLKHAALLMMDTDDLKKTNDQLGHEAGDQYLRGMAQILHTFQAPAQLSARLSGDEFAMLIYGCETAEELDERVAAMKALQTSVETKFSGQVLPVHFSLGVSYFPQDNTDHQQLLKLADQRMYEDKRRRKQPGDDDP